MPRDELEEARRAQLIEVTIDSLAEVGYVGTTLAQIARRAGVSPGLVAHYFGDKDGLLEAAFRALARNLAARMRARLALAGTPRGRVQAVIDINLAPEEFDKRTGTAWLAFWGQVLHVRGLKRVQTAYQRRMLSNLRNDLRPLIPAAEARTLAGMIAAMIDGVWLRAALSEWQEADSESARAMLTAFVEARLRDYAQQSAAAAGARPVPAAAGRPDRLLVINPASGATLAELAVDGAAEVDAAVGAGARGAACLGGVAGSGPRARAACARRELLRARNDELAELETRDTGKPIQETRVVDVTVGRGVPRVLRRPGRRASPASISISGPAAFGYTRREPLGVVAGIGAWNYPLQIACWKAAPALACGNAMIFKPAELTPLTAIKLAEIFAEAGTAATGVFQRGAGPRRHRPPAHPPPRHPQGVADRRGRHRQGGDGGRRRDAQARDARARRQIAADRVRGRAARQCGRPARCSATSIPRARCARTARECSCIESIKAAFLERLRGARRARCGSAIRSIPRPRSAR